MVVIISQVLRILSHLLLLVTQLAREPVTELPLRYLSFFSGMVFFSLAFNLIFLITRRIIIFILNFTYLILRKSIHQLVAVMDPRTTQGDSLLHLSVSKSNTLKTQVCDAVSLRILSKHRMNLRLSLRTEVKRLISSRPLLLQVSWLNVGQGDKLLCVVFKNSKHALWQVECHECP